jgi:hypothetical protein
MTTSDQLQTYLTEAQLALHKLLTGQQTVRLMYDGKEVSYTPSTVGDLRGYIAELETKLGIKPCRSRAARVYF